MKDQEILGEDSIPGQRPESGSHGMVLSLALWLDPGIPLSDFSHDPTLLPFFPKLFRICSGSPDKPWIASGRDVGGSKASQVSSFSSRRS